MKGFDAEFTDYADYIKRITDRIWKERNIGAIARYYAEDAVIHTLGGPVYGSEAVINNTIKTLAAFPDRRLDTEAVICTGDDTAGHYSSHRIISPAMTNLGHSEFGPPTGRQATVRTIADCAARENHIHEEWLMRDNMGLVQQLGLDPHAVAHRLAMENQHEQAVHDWLAREIERVASQPPLPTTASLADAKTDLNTFIRQVFASLWHRRDIDTVEKVYTPDACLHGPAGREMTGHAPIKAGISELHATLSGTQASVDHICSVGIDDDTTEVAIRWVLTGKHDQAGIYGAASGRRLMFLVGTHWRLYQGSVTEEWTVFDELAVLRQIYTP